MPIRYDFRRFDEDDDGDIDIDEFLSFLAEDVMEHGDLDAAIDRLLQEGFTTESGDRVEGLRELLERVRERRHELEREADPNGELEKYRQRLDDLEVIEASAGEDLMDEALASHDQRRIEVTRDLVGQRALERNLMGESLDERIRALQEYEFISSEAREEFEEMLAELHHDLLATYFERARDMATHPDAAEMQRVRSMMDALSTMIEQDRRGETLDPSFEAFMALYGDFFPGAQSLEDVVRAMAERAAAAEAMFNSLPAEQQSELRGLFSQMMRDLDFDFSLSRLVSNLRQAQPNVDWQRAHHLRGRGGGSLAGATDAAEQLGELQGLENFLGRSRAVHGLPEVDIDAVRRHLGDDAARHITRLQQAMKGLRDRGFVDRTQGRLEFTAKGVRQIAQHALKDLFGQLRDSPTLGGHRVATVARGGDREETAKAFEPGEPFSLHLHQTLRNALFRQGPGTPVKLHAEDFAVEEYEAARRSSTVFAIDLSLSMAMRGNLVPAKKMVLALTQLIRSKYPRDFVAVVGFGERAQELRIEDIAALTIDYNYGTNLQHALALSRHLMRNERGERQIVVVTDGEPTAHLDDTGEPFFSWPPVAETLRRTMAEVLRCSKAGIVINTFALDIERSQFPFVEQIAQVNGGRIFYTSVDELGVYALDDFVRSRRAS